MGDIERASHFVEDLQVLDECATTIDQQLDGRDRQPIEPAVAFDFEQASQASGGVALSADQGGPGFGHSALPLRPEEPQPSGLVRSREPRGDRGTGGNGFEFAHIIGIGGVSAGNQTSSVGRRIIT